MKRFFLIVLFTFLLIAVTGCKGGNLSSFFGGRGKSAPITSVDIYKGIDSLSITFMEGMPLSEISEEEPFNLGLLLKNKGTSHIGFDKDSDDKGYLLINFEKDYLEYDDTGCDINTEAGEWAPFSLEENRIRFRLRGKERYNIMGYQEMLTCYLRAKLLLPQIKSYKTKIFVQSCYPYKTIATQNVCIDTDIGQIINPDKPCQARVITSAGQGAPIVVTKIEPKPRKERVGGEYRYQPQFLITIENKGPGDVTNRNSVRAACSAKEAIDFNTVSISASFPGRDLECEKQNAKLKDGKATIKCSFNNFLNEVTTYSSPLTVVLDYGYIISGFKEVTIKKMV